MDTTAPSPSPRVAVAGSSIKVDRRRQRVGSRGGHALRGCSLHAEPAVLGENGHDAGDGAHGVGEERACARVEGRRVRERRAAAHALLLLLHLVARAVDLSGEAHGEAVAAPDGLLEQQGADDACDGADEVEREADEAEPVRRFA